MSLKKTMRLLECNVDDMNPEFFPYVVERLLSAGAKDAWLTPIVMKGGRPGSSLSVLFEADKEAEVAAIVFAETSTLGVRLQTVERQELRREQRSVNTPYGEIGVKVGFAEDGSILNIAPEHNDCRAAAKASGRPLKEIYQLAISAFYKPS